MQSLIQNERVWNPDLSVEIPQYLDTKGNGLQPEADSNMIAKMPHSKRLGEKSKKGEGKSKLKKHSTLNAKNKKEGQKKEVFADDFDKKDDGKKEGAAKASFISRQMQK